MSSVIQGQFGWDNSPFVNAMADAEKIAQKGATNVQNKFLSIFKRSPNMRAERAFSGLAQSLASGDIAGGIESITARMTGLGLIAGVAIGAGVAIFIKFKEQIDAAREASEALEAQLIKRPTSNVAKLSGEGIQQELQTRQKLIEDAEKKNAESGTASKIWAGLQQPISALTGGLVNTGAEEASKKRLQGEQTINQVISENKELMQAQSALISEMVTQKSMELAGDERGARISQIMLDTEQKRAALKNAGTTNRAFESADEGLSQNAELMITAENKRVAIKEQSLVIEEKMAKLIRGGLSTDEQKKVRAGLELKMLDSQISSEDSPIKKRALQLQRQQKENEIRAMGRPSGPSNPFAFGTTANRDFESDQGGFGTIAQRSKETADANQFGSLGNASMLRGESPLSAAQSQNAEVVAAIKEGNEITRKAWLTP